MTAILLASDDHHSFGPATPRRSGTDRTREPDMGIAGDKVAVPPAAAERPKSWLGRFIESMSKPVEPNYDNP
jgi:hypothetical protein